MGALPSVAAASRRPRMRKASAVLAGLGLLAGALAASPAPAASAEDEPSTPAATTAPLELTVLVPLSAPTTLTGLHSAEQLAELTGADGLLNTQLDALWNTPAVIAIDPALLASIRILGETAPESALAWLERMERMPNQVIALNYADADLGLLARAGVELPMAMPGFEQYQLSGIEEGLAPLSTEELLAFDYTNTTISWNATALDAAAIAALGEAGQVPLLGSGAVGQWPAQPRAALLHLDGTPVLVADQSRSALLSTAVAQDVSAGLSRSALLSRLQEAQASQRGTQRLLLTVERGTVLDPGALRSTLNQLAMLEDARLVGIDTLLAAAPAAEIELDPGAELLQTLEVLETLGTLLRDEERIAVQARALEHPEHIRDDHRLRMMALSGGSWASIEEWADAAERQLVRSERFRAAVQLEPSSDILLLANQAPLPVTVSNYFPYPVTVRVAVRVSNDRLVLESPVELTIEAQSKRAAQLPATVVANGRAQLTMTVSTLDGTRLDGPSTVLITVEAHWDVLVWILMYVAIGLLLVFGVWRSVRRRSRADTPSILNEPQVQP